MKFAVAATSMLLAGSVVATPLKERSRAAYERRMAKRAARRHTKTNPPLALNFTSLSDTVKLGSTTRATEYDSNWGVRLCPPP